MSREVLIDILYIATVAREAIPKLYYADQNLDIRWTYVERERKIDQGRKISLDQWSFADNDLLQEEELYYILPVNLLLFPF